MKVFISWSGAKSHKVGLAFREWLPSVIQSLEPYVSSEDIDKGARWSSDIAKELEDSTFGILCVTKDNLLAPWLSFEAGALSKTMDKSFVTPFLFDIKRVEVNGPILQFQSTVFEKDDLKKLLDTLNKACGDSGINQARLDKTFEVWYSNLEESLNKIKDDGNDENDEVEKVSTKLESTPIIEEILELSRDNQKLLRNPDSKVSESIEDVKNRLDYIASRFERNMDMDERRMPKKYKVMFVEELTHSILPRCQKQYGFLVALSFFQEDFPWVYNMGKELVDVIRSDVSREVKRESMGDFKRLLEFTCEHPIMREMYGRRKETSMVLRDMPHILMGLLMDLEDELQ